MRKVILGTLITIVLVGSALLVERSWRLNRSLPLGTAPDGQSNENSGPAAMKRLPPNVTFTNFSTKETLNFEKFQGKALLINFWASWCEACMAEMPSIQKLHDQLKGDGLAVIAINVDDNPEKVVPKIVSRLDLKFPVFTDPTGELSRIFEVAAIPYSIVTDRQHKIIWAESGERDWSSEKVIQEIRKVLAGT